MEEDLNHRPHRYSYKTRYIVLTPHLQDAEAWVCEYVIVELIPSERPSVRGFTTSRFLSPPEAKAAAQLLAQTIIDSPASPVENPDLSVGVKTEVGCRSPATTAGHHAEIGPRTGCNNLPVQKSLN